ncbi:AsnC-like helix-turn-helix protein [Laceyella sacchari]|uniref:Lrp/AsnC family transcriptional regulator n=1 Tax=Laceyella sacchari TaxID=37482 RepID=UPI0010EE4E1E|nr:Lrp/AsnC ligand binding domain-containing protein [Laceyella sacchari]TCW41698.1 AsnC-like helix-turn-helix protein [Laceyella sacchari]
MKGQIDETDKKIISGYHAALNMHNLNRGTTSFMLVKTEHCLAFIDFCKETEAVTDLFRISGEFNYLVKIQTATAEEIAEFQDAIAKLGHTKSLICLKNIFENRVVL